jgi:hypothetical protein
MNQVSTWRFRKMRPGEINVDPIEGEFFTTEVIGSLNDALVRESIQNSLDAAAGSDPVTVRLSFYNSPNLRSNHKDVIAIYLEGLNPHLHARHAGLQELPSPSETLDYILVEDYGTRGLQGDIQQYDDLDDDVKKNDFYYFWRNIGRTQKESTDLGRWGLGKTVFQAASRINSFFGFTMRKDDARLLLMGQSVLKIHKADGNRYAPYGYFGHFDGDLALPIDDAGYLESFATHFLVDRFGRPGLSVLIPFPDKDITPGECVKSAIKHYFFPILSGKLIVELRHAGKQYSLNAQTLDAYLKKSQWPEKYGMLGLMDFTRWAIQQTEEVFINLKQPKTGRAPKLRGCFEPDQIVDLQQRFSEGNRLAFYVPLTVQKQKTSELLHTGFSVFLERDENLEKAEDYFIRQGITIPEVSSLKHKGIRAIVSITEPNLSMFLGDAENPAHTEWERNSKKFKKKYKLGPSTLDFVKTSPREIVKILTQPQKGRDENLLKHIFALPTSRTKAIGIKAKDTPGEGDKKTSPEQFVDVVGFNYLQLTPIKGGFRLAKRPQATKLPRYITVWVAYDVRSGNPFKKYTPLDFDVAKSPITIQVQGAKVLLNKDNTIQIEVQKGNFKLAVIGFDMHRDLRIRTLP